MEYTTQCQICEQTQRKFYCVPCLRDHIREHRTRMAHVSAERDEQVAKAKRVLESVEQGRKGRADVAGLQAKVEEVRRNLKILREKNDQTRERLAALRASCSSRRQSLAQARTHTAAQGLAPLSPAATPQATVPVTSKPTPELVSATQAHAALQDTLARARSGLVQELVEVFGIVEVGGRPPLGGKAGSKGEWTIGGLVLPVPGDIRRYPPVQINAVITHTIHFLGLLTFYLGIKLPFEITWSGAKLGVGQASIYAGKGTESGGWARWSAENPLHLPLTPSPATSSLSSPTVSTAPTGGDGMSASQSLADLLDAHTASATPASFTTALAMLLYNVAYLAHTQAVEVPLSQTGEVLRNLWAVCCSPELGRRSHETLPPLPAPTPPTFPLDFSQLLQATTANPTPRSRPRSRRSSATGTSGRTSSRKQERIIEEDEWEVVD